MPAHWLPIISRPESVNATPTKFESVKECKGGKTNHHTIQVKLIWEVETEVVKKWVEVRRKTKQDQAAVLFKWTNVHIAVWQLVAKYTMGTQQIFPEDPLFTPPSPPIFNGITPTNHYCPGTYLQHLSTMISTSASWHCQWLVSWVKSILKGFNFPMWMDDIGDEVGRCAATREDVQEVAGEPSHCRRQWGMLISCCTAFHNFQHYPNNVNTVCSYCCTMQGISRKLCLSIHKGII